MTDPNPKMLFSSAVGHWHDWFAWFPIRTYDDRLVWLRRVRRRRMQLFAHLDGPSDPWWQYHAEGPS